MENFSFRIEIRDQQQKVSGSEMRGKVLRKSILREENYKLIISALIFSLTLSSLAFISQSSFLYSALQKRYLQINVN